MGDREAAARIAAEVGDLGLPEGGVALAHSSLRSLGPVPGGAETVIAGLRQALGPEGTLLLPALSYETVHAQNPVFDVLRTPSCVGWIPEVFRTMPGVQRSICPTHSVCGIGPLAPRLLGQHHLDDTPCGPHSPWRRLPEVDGYLLFVGCGLGPNTSMHAIEEVAQAPYLFGGTVRYTIMHPDGHRSSLACRRHNFRYYAHRYQRIAEIHRGDWIRVGQVLEATVHLVRASSLWDQAYEAQRRDPYFFVTPVRDSLP